VRLMPPGREAISKRERERGALRSAEYGNLAS